MSLETAPVPQNPKLVTSVVSQATSLVTALKMEPRVHGGTAERRAEEEEVNAINVVKLGTWLVHALMPLKEEGTLDLAAVRRRLVIRVVVLAICLVTVAKDKDRNVSIALALATEAVNAPSLPSLKSATLVARTDIFLAIAPSLLDGAA